MEAAARTRWGANRDLFLLERMACFFCGIFFPLGGNVCEMSNPGRFRGLAIHRRSAHERVRALSGVARHRNNASKMSSFCAFRDVRIAAPVVSAAHTILSQAKTLVLTTSAQIEIATGGGMRSIIFALIDVNNFVDIAFLHKKRYNDVLLMPSVKV